MTATINGTSWSATSVTAFLFPSAVVSISGTNATQNVGFEFVGSGPGTYPVPGPLLSPAAGNNGFYILNPNAQAASPTWTADINTGGSGSVTVTSFTTTAISGTFSFSMVASPGTGSTGAASITNGTFNAKF